MTDLFDADDNATPLTPEERNALIPTHVALRSELNELEQQNIAEADLWAFARKRRVLDEAFLRGLHRRMFYRVWRWAGDYRTTERNLGIANYHIQPELRKLIDD
jgi:fido (protein-threonine AMPylation protein)